MITINDIQFFIITRNRSGLLEQTIKNLLSQTAGIKEITVLDNESTDNTEEIVNKYYDKGVKYIKTFGDKANYLTSVSMSSKLYTLIFHDDDLLNIKYIQLALDMLNRYDNIAFITTSYTNFKDVNLINVNQNISKNHYLFLNQYDFALNMYFLEKIALCSCIFKTALLKSNPFEFEKYGKFFDWPYLVKMSSMGKVVLLADRNMLYVRIHEGQWTYDKKSPLTMQQIVNWDKCFYDALSAGNTISIVRYMFIGRFRDFMYDKYKHFSCEEDKINFSKNDLLVLAEKTGINTKGLFVMRIMLKLRVYRVIRKIFVSIIKIKNFKKVTCFC